MSTPPKYVIVPRNFAVFVLLGHLGGAGLFALAGALLAGPLTAWAALGGAALGGGFGAALGLAMLRAEDPGADAAARMALPPRRPWAAIGAGAVASVVVSWIWFSTSFTSSGFLDGSPCPELSAGRGLHIGTVQTLAVLGAVAIGWGLWRSAGARSASDSVFRALAGVVAVFLATVGLCSAHITLGP